MTDVSAEYPAGGDLDKDGTVGLNDVMMLFYAINGVQTLTEEQQPAADITRDGKVNLNDAVRLFYIVSGLI